MSKYHVLGYLIFASAGFLGGYLLQPSVGTTPPLLPPLPPLPSPPAPPPLPASTAPPDSSGDLRCRPLEHVFVINLAGPLGEARRLHAIRELAKVGLHGRYQFWPAVSAYDDASLAKELGKKHCPCDPQSALALSHRRIYEAIIAARWPCATIFEDDVSLARNFSRRLEAVSNSLPAFDTLQLGYCKRGKKVSTGPDDQMLGVFSCTSSIPSLQLLQGIPILISLPTLKYGWPGACLHAAIISFQGAALLAEVNTPLRTHADGAMDPKHWPNQTRAFLDRKPGSVPGSYWYTEPVLAWQGADTLAGGA
eukprot:s1695_g3.t2